MPRRSTRVAPAVVRARRTTVARDASAAGSSTPCALFTLTTRSEPRNVPAFSRNIALALSVSVEESVTDPITTPTARVASTVTPASADSRRMPTRSALGSRRPLARVRMSSHRSGRASTTSAAPRASSGKACARRSPPWASAPTRRTPPARSRRRYEAMARATTASSHGTLRTQWWRVRASTDRALIVEITAATSTVPAMAPATHASIAARTGPGSSSGVGPSVMTPTSARTKPAKTPITIAGAAAPPTRAPTATGLAPRSTRRRSSLARVRASIAPAVIRSSAAAARPAIRTGATVRATTSLSVSAYVMIAGRPLRNRAPRIGMPTGPPLGAPVAVFE